MVALSTEGKGGRSSEAVPLGVSWQGALIGLLGWYMRTSSWEVGDHSVSDDVHGINIPTAPEVVPNKLLRLHIKGCEEEDFGLNLQTS